MNIKIVSLSVLTFSMILIFQNCGKVSFSTVTPTLYAATAPPSGGGSDLPPPDSGKPGNPSMGGNSDNPPSDNPPGENNSELVECDLGGPSVKVTLGSSDLQPGSNAAVSRVCMSSNACLNLVNAYVSVRGCSLAVGAASSAAVPNCAQIFPGSQGTCKNAQDLSDAQIVSILAAMVKK